MVRKISPDREVVSPFDTSGISKMRRKLPRQALNPRMLERSDIKRERDTLRISEGNLKRQPVIPYVS